MPKNIKGSENSLFRNYWKKKCIYKYTIEKYKKKIGYVKKKKKSMAITVEIFPTI